MLETLTEASVEEAKSALRTSPVFALRNVSVEPLDEKLLLTGTVSTFSHKQLAQEVVRTVVNGTSVINLIQVVSLKSPSDHPYDDG